MHSCKEKMRDNFCTGGNASVNPKCMSLTMRCVRPWHVCKNTLPWHISVIIIFCYTLEVRYDSSHSFLVMIRND